MHYLETHYQGCGLDGISIEAEAEVKAGPFHRGRGRGRGRIKADLLALQQATSFHFRSFIFDKEDKQILASLIVFSVEMCFIN